MRAINEELEAVRLFARAKMLERQAKRALEEARAKALELHDTHGLTLLEGNEGQVLIVHTKAPELFDKDRAKHFMSPEEWASCVKVGKPGVQVKFEAKR